MNENIDGLRKRLFEALDGLSDSKKPMEIERARAIADVARVIIDSAKAEIQLLHVTGARGPATAFIPVAVDGPPVAGQRRLAAGGCPACGGALKADTNGNGGLVDRCTNCGRIQEPAVKGQARSHVP